MRILSVAVLVLLAGCSQPVGTIDDDGIYRTGHQLEGRPAPSYSADLLTAGPSSLAELEGQVVLLSVWASWCSICKGDEPTWEHLQSDYGAQGFTVFAVSHEQSRSAAADYAVAQGWEFPALWDRDVNHQFDMRNYQPNYILIDRNGTVQSVYESGSFKGRPGGVDGLRHDIEAFL